jgi:hypothetical protein
VTFADVTRERLAKWAKDIEPGKATPLILLCIGHEEFSGDLTICVPEDLPREVMVAFLRKTLRILEMHDDCVED